MPEIFIYDAIGQDWFGQGITGKSIVDELAKTPNQRVTLRINSPGGSVDDAMAIYNAVARHPGGVDVEIDGLAASAASYVAMAGRSVRIAENAMIMVHPPLTFAIGDAAQMRKVAEILDTYAAGIVAVYQARTKGKSTPEQVADWVAAETWMTATQAVERGFADAVGQALVEPAKVPENRYRNTPANLLAAPKPPPNFSRERNTLLQKRLDSLRR